MAGSEASYVERYVYDAANRQVNVASTEADGATRKLFQAGASCR